MTQAGVAAVLTFLPLFVGLLTVKPAPSPWFYLLVAIATMLAGGGAYATSRTADRATSRLEEALETVRAERDRLEAERDVLTAERSAVAKRLSFVTGALNSVAVGRAPVETSFMNFVLEHLRQSLPDAGERRIGFLAYRGARVLSSIKHFPLESSVSLASVGAQGGALTPLQWLIERGSADELRAIKLMEQPGPEHMFFFGKPPDVEGQDIDLLRGPKNVANPPVAWCRAGVTAGGERIGLLCVDVWAPYTWTEFDLEVIDAFATVLGLGFKVEPT